MRIVLAVLLSLCIMCPVAFGDQLNSNANVQESDVKKIPQYTNTNGHTDGNGRPQHLDTENRENGASLNPVERTIIMRDTVITNRPQFGMHSGR